MSGYEEFGNLERQGWAELSRAVDYVKLFSTAADQAIQPLLAAISVSRGMRVLDLCCGQGNVTTALLAAGCDVVGADFSPAMLLLAKSHLHGATFVEADAQDLPFEDGEFDAVVSNFGISHVPDQHRALAEVRRVLRKDGSFAMTVWCGPDVSPAFRTFRDAVKLCGDPLVRVPDGPDTHRFANRDVATELLSAADFTDIQFDTVDCAWVLSSPSGLAQIFEKATVRAASLMAQQRPAFLAAIRKEMTQRVRQDFAVGTKWRVPVPAALVMAR